MQGSEFIVLLWGLKTLTLECLPGYMMKDLAHLPLRSYNTHRRTRRQTCVCIYTYTHVPLYMYTITIYILYYIFYIIYTYIHMYIYIQVVHARTHINRSCGRFMHLSSPPRACRPCRHQSIYVLIICLSDSWLSACLPACLSVCLSLPLSPCLSICPSVFGSIYLSVHLRPYISRSICLPIYPPVSMYA